MKHKKLKLALLVNIVFAVNVVSQNVTNTWYFGSNAGIKFVNKIPTVLMNSAMNTNEGCITQSDINGNVLFYSNGEQVWDSNHTVMPNGSGLFGGFSATQSAVVVPDPGNVNRYYLFTVPNLGSGPGLCYSLIDMTLNGGLGDVVTKNTIAYNNSNLTEKLHATYKLGSNDAWVITEVGTSNTYVVVEVTAAGVGTPIIQSVGSIHNWGPGALKFSHDGKKLAVADYGNQAMELFDFDLATGTLSNPAKFNFPAGFPTYGFEYSAGGKYLYVSNVDVQPGLIWQFDLSSGVNTTIVTTGQQVMSINSITGLLQLGPDDKIYCPTWSSNFLSVINAPDSAGAKCNAVINQFNTINGTLLGLPQWIAGTLGAKVKFENLCFGDTTKFAIPDSPSVAIVQWDFDDPSSGPANVSYLYAPYHIFTAPGTYNVQVVMVYQNTSIDTLTYTLNISPVPAPNLGVDTSLCIGQVYTMNPGTFATYLWNNGSTNTSYTTTVSGTYTVQVSNSGGCKAMDTVLVDFVPCQQVVINIATSDTIFCEKQCIDFYDMTQNQPYQWQWYFQGASPATSTDQNPSAICYNNYGSFNVTLVACNLVGCDSVVFPLFITELVSPPAPAITQSGDTLICNTSNVTYAWYNTNNPNLILGTMSYYIPSVAGSYYVVITDSNNCDVSSPSFVSNVGVEEIGSTGILLTVHTGGNQMSIASTNANQPLLTATVYDNKGCVVLRQMFSDHTYHVNMPLPEVSSIYFVQVVVSDGQKIFTIPVMH